MTSASPLTRCLVNTVIFGGYITPCKSHRAPSPNDPTWLPAPHGGGSCDLGFIFVGVWISRQTPKCCRICPLHLRAAEAPSRDTSLVGTTSLPALLLVLHLISLRSHSTREKTCRKADDDHLSASPSRLSSQERRKQGYNAPSMRKIWPAGPQ